MHNRNNRDTAAPRRSAGQHPTTPSSTSDRRPPSQQQTPQSSNASRPNMMGETLPAPRPFASPLATTLSPPARGSPVMGTPNAQPGILPTVTSPLPFFSLIPPPPPQPAALQALRMPLNVTVADPVHKSTATVPSSSLVHTSGLSNLWQSGSGTVKNPMYLCIDYVNLGQCPKGAMCLLLHTDAYRSAGRPALQLAFPRGKVDVTYAIPPDGVSLHRPGWDLHVYDEDVTTFAIYPSTNVIQTLGSIRFVAHKNQSRASHEERRRQEAARVRPRHQEVAHHHHTTPAQSTSPEERSMFFLCGARARGTCTGGGNCELLHVVGEPSYSSEVHCVEGDDVPPEERTRVADLARRGLMHLLPAGKPVQVYYPEQRTIFTHADSGTILKTVGSEAWWVGNHPTLRVFHCTHFLKKRLCNKGPLCNFFHVLPSRTTSTIVEVPAHREVSQDTCVEPEPEQDVIAVEAESCTGAETAREVMGEEEIIIGTVIPHTVTPSHTTPAETGSDSAPGGPEEDDPSRGSPAGELSQVAPLAAVGEELVGHAPLAPISQEPVPARGPPSTQPRPPSGSPISPSEYAPRGSTKWISRDRPIVQWVETTHGSVVQTASVSTSDALGVGATLVQTTSQFSELVNVPLGNTSATSSGVFASMTDLTSVTPGQPTVTIGDLAENASATFGSEGGRLSSPLPSGAPVSVVRHDPYSSSASKVTIVHSPKS